MVQANSVQPTRRFGLKTLRSLAQRVCAVYVKFAPVIQVVFVENVALIIALEAVNVACANLVKEIDGITTEGV